MKIYKKIGYFISMILFLGSSWTSFSEGINRDILPEITYENRSRPEVAFLNGISFNSLAASPLSQAVGGPVSSDIIVDPGPSQNVYVIKVDRFVYKLHISRHRIVIEHDPESGVLLLKDMDHTLFPLGKRLDEETAPYQYEFCFEVLKTISSQTGLKVHNPEIFDFKGRKNRYRVLSKSGFKPVAEVARAEAEALAIQQEESEYFNPYAHAEETFRQREKAAELRAQNGAYRAKLQQEEYLAKKEAEAHQLKNDGGAVAAGADVEGFTRVSLNKVSINLMWLNETKNEESTYIVDQIEREGFEVFGLEQILKWMVLNPLSHVVYWYDVSKNTVKQVQTTLELVQAKIAEVAAGRPELSLNSDNFSMRAIQELGYVSNNPGKKIFQGEKENIYFKADLARILAAIDTLKEDTYEAYIYADWVVNPHSISKIYPHGFHDNGFMAIKSLSDGYPPWENSYMVFTRSTRNLIGIFSKLFRLIFFSDSGDERMGSIKKDGDGMFGLTLGAVGLLYHQTPETDLDSFNLGLFNRQPREIEAKALLENVTLTRDSGHSSRVRNSPNKSLEEILEELTLSSL